MSTEDVLAQVLALPEDERKMVLTKAWESFDSESWLPSFETLEELKRRAQSITDGTAVLRTEEEMQGSRAKILKDYLARSVQ